MRKPDEASRGWTYRGGLLLIAVLIAVDIFQGGDAAGWVTLVAGFIGLGAAGLASANTSTKKKELG